LLVPDILQLGFLEQEILRSVLERDTAQRPLLMVGALHSYADLRDNPKIDRDFLTSLARAYIKLTRPFSEYKDQGLIHYFLDSLSQSPT